MLLKIESAAKHIGIFINAEKTEYININQKNKGQIKSNSVNPIKQINDFKYMGSYIDLTEQDMNIKIAKAWSALNSMNVIWKSSLSRKQKINFFRAAVESVLL